MVTKQIHKQHNAFFQWQRSFYDRIIRDDLELNDIRQYIINNPQQWELDDENPNK